MDIILNGLSAVMDAFGASVVVPVILFIISLFMKVSLRKSFESALNAGIGLTGFNMLIGAYTPIVTPVVERMVDSTGINLNILDTGWQATSVVAYSTEAGMIFLGLALVIQIGLYALKYTDVFIPSDLWNNYSYMIWGSMLYIVTGNMLLSIVLMITMNLVTMTLAELWAKRWSNYYGYPGTTIVASHNLAPIPYAIAIDWVLNKLGADKIKLDTETLKSRLGVFGEPAALGFVLGILLGFAGNWMRLNTLVGWGEIFGLGIATSAIMAIFPRVAAIFASAFTNITDASKASASSEDDDREWYLGINDAAGYGEPGTLLSGLTIIPIILLIAIFAPGNQALPLVDLIAIPYLMEGIIPTSNGNIFKTIITGVIYLTISLYLVTAVAPIFTEVAVSVGISLPAGALMIFSLGTLANHLGGILFFAFLSQNPIIIGFTIIATFAFHFLFKKNKERIHDYLERNALGDDYIKEGEEIAT